jgi:hypothetical protein
MLNRRVVIAVKEGQKGRGARAPDMQATARRIINDDLHH